MADVLTNASVPQLANRLRALRTDGQRVIVGITGAPGAGKSTLAAALAEHLGTDAVVVGMDGFHLAQRELERLGRAARKGAPDTFDVAGYVTLLRRLRKPDEPVVYAPQFRREIEEPIANAVPVSANTPIVLTEGNYLLLDQPGWRDVRALLDEVWFLDLPADERQERLIRRRLASGATAADAQRWTLGSDEQNARLVERTRHRADLLIDEVPR
jgi:pantothenate kinase